MPIDHIAIISVPVRDQNASLAFYRDQLGFRVVRDNPMGPKRRWVEVAPEGAKTTFTLVTWFDKMPAGTLQGMVLSTKDIDKTRGELVEHNVEVGEVQAAPWGRYATFQDPDGNGFVLQEPAPNA